MVRNVCTFQGSADWRGKVCQVLSMNNAPINRAISRLQWGLGGEGGENQMFPRTGSRVTRVPSASTHVFSPVSTRVSSFLLLEEASQVRIYVPSEINARETFKRESHCQGLRPDIKPESCLFSLGSVTGEMDNEGHQGS